MQAESATRKSPKIGRAALRRTLLGGLTPREFLRDYWQKKPLLVRGALPSFLEPLSIAEVKELATREEAESRLVVGRGRHWTMEHGPLARRVFKALASSAEPWTVLVQDVQHHSPPAHDLLARFDFIPTARIDDLMVSYAVDGGGVGPHVDSYDVFLLQGRGRRRWSISTQGDLALTEGMPLKILKRFRAEQEFVLEKGDMLYLPPQVAHHGIALGECLTWSIGFRAPSHQEILAAYLDFLRDDLVIDGRYQDPGLAPVANPGRVPAAMEATLRRTLADALRRAQNPAAMNRALGQLLTEPKPHVFFDPPQEPLPRRAFARMASAHGVRLALASRLLRLGQSFFINGRELPCPPGQSDVLQLLADRRHIEPSAVQESAGAMAVLYELYRSGEIEGMEPRGGAR